MPKKVFWPASLVSMGFIFLASNLGYLPRAFWNLWPIILIVVGLGGLLTSDKEEWESSGKKTAKKVVKKAVRKRKK
ncbi:hypothetical protein KKD03_04155 [Patescibacteria group bacterium]|nr:hypothetical protein [Patescibacteria group bacterium]